MHHYSEAMVIHQEHNKCRLALHPRCVREHYMGRSYDPNRTHIESDKVETKVACFPRTAESFDQQFILALLNIGAP